MNFWQLIEDRRAIRDRLLRAPSTRRTDELRIKYNDINKKIKRQARQDKRGYAEGMAAEAKEVARRGDVKTLYEIIRKLAKDKTNNNTIKDENGNLITVDEEQLKIWREHFERILNVITPDNQDPPQEGDKPDQ